MDLFRGQLPLVNQNDPIFFPINRNDHDLPTPLFSEKQRFVFFREQPSILL
jgi:hypothetical protein